MRYLSIAVALFGLLALALGVQGGDGWEIGAGISALLCAGTTYLSAAISSYLKVFVRIFSIEKIAASAYLR